MRIPRGETNLGTLRSASSLRLCLPPGRLPPRPVAIPSAFSKQVTQTLSAWQFMGARQNIDQKSVYTTKPGGEGFGFAFAGIGESFRFKLGKSCHS